MTLEAFVQTGATLAHGGATFDGNARAVVVDPQPIAVAIRLDAQANLAARPLAGVVQQIAEQLQHILAFPGQPAARRRLPVQRQVTAVDGRQGGEQRRQFLCAIEAAARLTLAGQPGAAQFAGDPLANLAQLLLQLLAQRRLAGQGLAVQQAGEHRQRRLQGVAEIADGMPRAFQGLVGLRQQVVDLRDQRLQFLRHVGVELGAAALLQLGDLHAGTFQRAQGGANRQALQQPEGQQREAEQSQSAEAHLAETVEDRGVVLGHADVQGLAAAPVLGAVDQEALPLRPVDQF